MLRCLRRAVEIESPTNSKKGVDRMARFFARQLRALHAKVRILPHRTAGSCVCAELWSDVRDAKPILLLGHLDTVWAEGTLKRMPFRVRQGRAHGPGILDMKSGIVLALWAVRALQRLGLKPASPVRFFLNPDEETATVAFRRQLLAEARAARAVLVLEPSGPGGTLKVARKGVGKFRITVHGRSAHAGVDPEKGVNAISELVRQLLRIEKLAAPHRGLTLNVGVIQGGTRTNVIPETAYAVLDVRIPLGRDRLPIERKIHALKPFNPQARLEITGGINRPPMERKVAKVLFRRARELGRELGLELVGISTGGGSDGNFTAALGTPTLDGLGGVGNGGHARHEHVIISELPRRAALLAALIATL
jgi:glutamate carboxypeptidase